MNEGFVVALSLLILFRALGGDAGVCASCEKSPLNGLGTYCEGPYLESSLAGLQEGELNIIHTLLKFAHSVDLHWLE